MTADAIGANKAAEIIEKENKIILNKLAPFEKIVQHLAAIGFSSIDDYVEISEGGEITALSFDAIRARKKGKIKILAIKKIKEKTTIAESKDGETIYKNSQVEYELYDKPGALQYLMKLRGDEPAAKTEVSYTDQIQYTKEEKEILKTLAIEQAKKELKALRGQ